MRRQAGVSSVCSASSLWMEAAVSFIHTPTDNRTQALTGSAPAQLNTFRLATSTAPPALDTIPTMIPSKLEFVPECTPTHRRGMCSNCSSSPSLRLLAQQPALTSKTSSETTKDESSLLQNQTGLCVYIIGLVHHLVTHFFPLSFESPLLFQNFLRFLSSGSHAAVPPAPSSLSLFPTLETVPASATPSHTLSSLVPRLLPGHLIARHVSSLKSVQDLLHCGWCGRAFQVGDEMVFDTYRQEGEADVPLRMQGQQIAAPKDCVRTLSQQQSLPRPSMRSVAGRFDHAHSSGCSKAFDLVQRRAYDFILKNHVWAVQWIAWHVQFTNDMSSIDLTLVSRYPALTRGICPPFVFEQSKSDPAAFRGFQLQPRRTIPHLQSGVSRVDVHAHLRV